MTYEEFDVYRYSLPEEAGVYRYYDASGQLLYVGKAKNLRKRVSSYFIQKRYDSAKLKMLVSRINHIEFTLVSNEQDALLLENALIKEHQPKFNVQLKDDKTYPYVCIKNENFPRVVITRNVVKDGSEYFGPYTSIGSVRVILDTFTKAFPLRTCALSLSDKNIEAAKFKVCLEYHIGNCGGPCAGLQSKETYMAMIKNIRHILRGNTAWVINELTLQMQKSAALLEFEQAAKVKEKLVILEKYYAKSTIVNPTMDDIHVFSIASQDKYAVVNYLKILHGTIVGTRTFHTRLHADSELSEILYTAIDEVQFDNDDIMQDVICNIELPDMNYNGLKITHVLHGDKKKLLDLSYRNSQYALKERLQAQLKRRNESPVLRILTKAQVDLRLKDLPIHIECFDNSNIQGTHPVSACVVFKNARPSKQDYRHFKVQTVVGPNDFATMEEAVYRRYHRLLEEKQTLPQLIIIDGGKGQLSAAMKSIESLGLRGKIAVIGIAKKLEEIYYPDDSLPLYIDKKSETLKLIQKLRDEAHRFGLAFHRKLRSKSALQSSLDSIEGIGPTTRKKLFAHFKTIRRLKDATLDELTAICGATRAAILYNYFNDISY